MEEQDPKAMDAIREHERECGRRYEETARNFGTVFARLDMHGRILWAILLGVLAVVVKEYAELLVS